MKDNLRLDFLKKCMECCRVGDVASVVGHTVLKVGIRCTAQSMYWPACWILEQISDDMVT